MAHKDTINELQFIVNVMQARYKDVVQLSHSENYTREQRDMATARATEILKWQSALEKVITCSGV